MPTKIKNEKYTVDYTSNNLFPEDSDQFNKQNSLTTGWNRAAAHHGNRCFSEGIKSWRNLTDTGG